MDPHEFKWGWDAKEKRVHHWPSSERARRTHRDDFASLIGRDVRVQDGDVMGHGTYLPEERQEDRNVVGPPTVLLRATYGAEIPTDVLHHFENVFPATEVRRGHKHEHPPTHHEAKIEWVAPMSGAEWARANFNYKIPKPETLADRFDRMKYKSERSLRELGHTAAWMTAGADMEGAMVAVFIPEATGKKIQIDGGEPVDNMHITLAYFSDKAADRDDWDKVTAVVERIAEKHGTLDGKIGGYGVFKGEKGDVLWAAPDVPGLAELRHELITELETEGFDLNEEHGWSPHITLKYDWEGDFPDMDEPIDVSFDQLTFAQGEKKNHKRMASSMGQWTEMTQLAWEFIQGQEFIMSDLFKVCESVGGDFGKISENEQIFDPLIEKIMKDPGLKQHLEEYVNISNERTRGIRTVEFYLPSYEEWHDILEGIADNATDPRGGMFLGFGEFDFQPGDTTTLPNLLMPDSSPGDTTIPEDWHTSALDPDEPLENAWTPEEQQSVLDQKAVHDEQVVDPQISWQPQFDDPDAAYTKMVRNIYERLQRADPRDPIVSGEIINVENAREDPGIAITVRRSTLEGLEYYLFRQGEHAAENKGLEDLKASFRSDFGGPYKYDDSGQFIGREQYEWGLRNENEGRSGT